MAQVTNIGGTFFRGVRFPIAFGERYVSILPDPYTGVALVDVYRWDRDEDHLVVEMFHGRLLPGAPPLTVTPYDRAGGIRLGVAGGDVVGYLSGPKASSIIVTREKIEVMEGDQLLMEIRSGAIIGSPVGLLVDDDGGIALGAKLPPDFPERRAFIGAHLDLGELVRGNDPVIRATDFIRCRVTEPAVVAQVERGATFENCVLPGGAFIWDLPFSEGQTAGIVNGAIALDGCSFVACELLNVGIAAQRAEAEDLRRMVEQERQ